MKRLIQVLVALLVVAAVTAIIITRDGHLVTPNCEGSVSLDSGSTKRFHYLITRWRRFQRTTKAICRLSCIKVHILEVGLATRSTFSMATQPLGP